MKKLISLILTAAMLAALPQAVGFAEGSGPEANDELPPEATAEDTVVPAGDAALPAQTPAENTAVTEAAAEDYNEIIPMASGDISSVVLPLSEYDTAMAAIEGTAEEKAENPEYIQLLLQRRLVEKAGYEKLIAKMSTDTDFAECIEWLFTDYEMLCYYVYGGEPEANVENTARKLPDSSTYMKSFEVLTLIYKNHKDDINHEEAPVLKRLMAAVALTHSVKNSYWDPRFHASGYRWYLESEPLGRYELYRKFYLNGFLIDQFDQYTVEELRMVVSAPVDNDQLEWMHYYYRVKRLGDSDYATDPLQITRNRLGAAGGWFPYATAEINPWGLGARFYDEANRDYWTSRYALSVHDDYFDYDVAYGFNENGDAYAPEWIFFEVGGVCVQISMCSVVGFNAMGLPSMKVVQPGHLSFWQYYKSGDKVSYTHGYNVFGLTKSTAKEYGQTHLPAGWGDLPYTSYYNMGYLFLGTDAIYGRDNTNFEKAENLSFMGNNCMSAGDYEGAIELYNKAVEAQYFNMDAWDGLAKAYEALNKSDEDYYALAQRAADALKWYPTTMFDYITACLMPKVQNQVIKADMTALVWETLNVSASATTSNSPLVQPTWCLQLANDCRNRLSKLASFSFDTGAITLNKSFSTSGADFLYSFDDGATWNTREYIEGETALKLTDEEIAQITVQYGILCKLDGEEKNHRIAIGSSSTPACNAKTNTPNDNEDVFLNIEKGLEYSTDSGATWQPLTSASTFMGDVTVWVRRRATGAVRESGYATVYFTQNEGTPERSYIKMKNNVKLVSSPESMSSNPASYAWDGDTSTMWINAWSNTKYSMYKGESGSWLPNHNYDFVFELNDPRYISALSYLPGNAEGAIRGCEIYVSTDGTTWQKAGSTSLWNADANEKTLELETPVYAKYIKIHTTEVGTTVLTMGSRSADVGYATVKEFKFYENYAINSKTISELRLITDGVKTEYKVGDKLDLTNLTAELIYTDGTASVIPTNELKFDADIFNSTETEAVTAEYMGVTASYDVNVLPNDREASAIKSATPADRKYYAGDMFNAADALVLVTDGEEEWYLMPDEFSVEGILAEGNSLLTAVHNGLTKDFSVTVQKAVSGIRLNSDSEDFKSQYFIGEELDISGLTVTLVYDDNSEAELADTDYEIEMYAGDTAADLEDFSQTSGNKTLRVSLLNKDEAYAEANIMVFPYISSGDFEFEAIEGTTQCKLTAYNPSEDISGKTVEIPAEVMCGGTKFTVTTIESNAFSGAPSLASVYIPDTVMSIRTDAFTSCTALKDVYMEDYDSFDGFECADGAFAAVEDGYVYVSSSLAGINSPIEGYAVADFTANAEDIILTAPEKLNYILNEELDTTDMVVTAVLKDGSMVNTKSYTVSGYNPAVTGEQTVTVSINGTRLGAAFTVNVSFPAVRITKSPASSAYVSGDKIEPLTVQAEAGSGDISYQWYRSETNETNGTPINGAVSASYTPSAEGYYYAAAYIEDADGNTSDYVYSEIARVLIGDYEAIVGTDGYAVLSDAVSAAQDKDTVRLCKDITVNNTISVSGKNITIDGNGYQLSRENSFTSEFFRLSDSANVTLENITLDGGAVWTGETNSVLKRGTTNSGITAVRPLIAALSGTTLTLSKGSVLQNNYNGYSTNAYYTGGAVYMGPTDNSSAVGATMLIDGGVIRNNSSSLFGSAVYMRGNSVFTVQDGVIEGNSDPNPAGGYNASAICADNDSTATVRGGVFRNNLGGQQGGVFWIGNGTLTIRDGVFENNYSANGGAAYFYNGSKSTLALSGGEFRNNSAGENGGVIYIQKNASVSGGVFENNSAQNGGVIWTNSTLSLNGGKFINNTADKGDAVYVDTAQTVTISSIDTLQEIYLNEFKTLPLIGNFANKTLTLTTPSEITNDIDVATMTMNNAINASINGRKLYVVNDEGFKLRTKTEYAVTYHKNGGTIENEYNYAVYVDDKALTLPTPVKTGYSFDGWYDNETLTGDAVTVIPVGSTGDKEYWAKWTPQTYGVTLHTNGGAINGGSVSSYTYGEGVLLPADVTRNHYIFAGWYDNEACEGSAVTAISETDTGHKTYWAKWTPQTYDVILNANGGTVHDNLTSYTYSIGATLPTNVTKDGYYFEGWYDNKDLAGEPITVITHDSFGIKEYWAKWEEKPPTEYFISFINYNEDVLQEGYAAVGEVPEYNGETPTKPSDERYTYSFGGWSPEITRVDGVAVYTATFDAVPRAYSVTLNTDGGVFDRELASYTYGEGAALPSAVMKNGFYFEGWYDNKDFSGNPINMISSDSTGDKTYWAKWVPKTYSITLHPDDGILTENLTSYTYNEGAVLPVKITKDGYYFDGWYDNEALTGNPVTAIPFDSIGDKEYWAKWSAQEPSSYFITFLNYDDTVLQEGYVAVGETPEYTGEMPSRPSDGRYAYTFSGFTPQITAVTGMAVYKAEFTRTPVIYDAAYANGKAVVTSPAAGTYSVIFASYIDGILMSAAVSDVTFDKADEKTVSAPETFVINGSDTIKVMMWNSLDGMSPKCDPDIHYN